MSAPNRIVQGLTIVFDTAHSSVEVPPIVLSSTAIKLTSNRICYCVDNRICRAMHCVICLGGSKQIVVEISTGCFPEHGFVRIADFVRVREKKSNLNDISADILTPVIIFMLAV